MRSLRRLARLSLPTLVLVLACNGNPPSSSETTSSTGDGDADGTGDGDGDTEPEELRSEAPHDDNPELMPGEAEALAAANHALSLDLYHALRNGQAAGQGFAVSTFGIHSAFSLLYGGTSDPARTQMSQTLQFDLAGDRQHVANNWLATTLESRNIPAQGDGDGDGDGGGFEDAVELHTANSVWVLDGLASGISDAYLDLLSIHYDTGLKLADFDGQPDLTTDLINAWVSQRTNDLIPTLFGPGSINELTTLVLVNALYLKGPWAEPFSLAGTWDFTRLDNQVISVDTIRNGNMVYSDYGVGPDYQAVNVVLRGGYLELVVIMPNDLTSFEDSLDPAKLDAVLASLGPAVLDLRMPLFELESSFDLASMLQNLGMVAPFADTTSFDSIHPDLNVIETVVHQTVIKIDEHGLEAAATTGIGGDGDGDGDPPPPPTVVIIDKPFLVAVRDTPTDTLLFFGRVLDPSL